MNRADIVEAFDVSVPQASKDLSLYQAEAPENIWYDKSQKRYFASERFSPKFIQLDAETYLNQLLARGDVRNGASTSGLGLLDAERIPIPARRIEPSVLRSVVHAVRERMAVDIHYQSMNTNKPEPMWRRISPRAFGTDGFRWHVRAFCHEDQQFKDFILARIHSVSPPVGAGNSATDHVWDDFFTVELEPNPVLSESQKRAIALDFGMTNFVISVPVRKAMLYYFVKRLRLDLKPSLARSHEEPVVVRNKEALLATLSQVAR